MKTYRKELWFNTPTRVAFANITPQVEECIRESGVREGMALVNAMQSKDPNVRKRAAQALGEKN